MNEKIKMNLVFNKLKRNDFMYILKLIQKNEKF